MCYYIWFRLNEAKEWLSSLSYSGGCNLLAAVKLAYTLEDLDTVCIIVTSL